MSFGLVKSPWVDELRGLAGAAQRSVTIVAPYVSSAGWRVFLDALSDSRDVRLDVYTTLDAEAVADGYLDVSALASACAIFPEFNLRHIPRLHAKIYVADSSRAIVTSGNLTMSSLTQNNEYGVRVSDRAFVMAIKQDINEYAKLGAYTSCSSLQEIASLAVEISAKRSEPITNVEHEKAIRNFDLRVRSLRGEQHESRNAIFARTILYLLAKKPMRTQEMHPLIKSIHPDLCDDDIDREINGVSFGRLWKHSVRNAQLTLRRQGRILRRDDEKWLLRSVLGSSETEPAAWT